MSVGLEATLHHEQDTDNLANCSDQEGDALFPSEHPNITSIKFTQAKQIHTVCNIVLFLCPYMFGVIFLVVSCLFYYFVLSAPTIAVLNAFPGTESVLLDLTNITKNLSIRGNVSIVNTNDYRYSYTNYFFETPPFERSICGGTKFYTCNETLKPSSVRSYSIHSSDSPCAAFLTPVENQTYSELKYITKVSDAPQIYDYTNKYFYGVKFPQNNFLTQGCLFSSPDNENSFTQIVPTAGLYSVNQSSVNISLPHYVFDSAFCKEISLTTPIAHNAKLLIVTNYKVSSCKLVIRSEPDLFWDLKFSCFLFSICFIFVFLIACDISNWTFGKFFKKKYE